MYFQRCDSIGLTLEQVVLILIEKRIGTTEEFNVCDSSYFVPKVMQRFLPTCTEIIGL